MDDITRDNGGDATSDITWMSYAELGKARGISAASAKRLAIRRHWRRHQGNDGTARVAVPVTEAVRREVDTSDAPGDNTGDVTSSVAALQVAIATLREQLEEANGRADAAEARAEQERQRADRAEAARDAAGARSAVIIDDFRAERDNERARAGRAEMGREGERARADALRDRLTAMQEQLADAHATLQAAEVATTHAQQAEASRDTERQRADHAERGREADRARADVLQAKLDDMQVQLTTRQEVIDAAEVIRKADDARLARGRWARLRAAWRGK